MPAAQGVVNWPSPGLSASALVEPTLLPLPTASIDRVVLVHALEETESPDDLLEEVSRVLNPGGRMILVVPNRRGLWARMDGTPFGQGRPCESVADPRSHSRWSRVGEMITARTPVAS